MDRNEAKNLKSFMSKARENNSYSDKIVSNVLLFSNVWATLIAPALIGMGISYLYSLSEGTTPPGAIWFLFAIFAVIHLAFSYLVHQNNSKFTLYSEAISLKEEYEKNMSDIRHELAVHKKGYKDLSNLFSNQITTLYIMSYVTDNAIGHINELEKSGETLTEDELEKLIERDLFSMIRPIILEREALFNYNSSSLYNVALYAYDELGGTLEVLVRDCDNRLKRRNRAWKPGHGHVGLAFLHKEVKICPDITMSSELVKDADVREDETRYRSFISIPILRCEDDGNVDNGKLPFGVLVLTSADADQFVESRDLQFLSTIAKNLAIYLAAAETYRTHSVVSVPSKLGGSDEKSEKTK